MSLFITFFLIEKFVEKVASNDENRGEKRNWLQSEPVVKQEAAHETSSKLVETFEPVLNQKILNSLCPLVVQKEDPKQKIDLKDCQAYIRSEKMRTTQWASPTSLY